MIRGGQGRTARDVEESAQALVWCLFVGGLLLAMLWWLQGGA